MDGTAVDCDRRVVSADVVEDQLASVNRRRARVGLVRAAALLALGNGLRAAAGLDQRELDGGMDACIHVAHEAVVERVRAAVDGQNATDRAIRGRILAFLDLNDAAAAPIDDAREGFVEVEKPEVAVVTDAAVEAHERGIRDLLIAIEIHDAASVSGGIAADLDVAHHRSGSTRFRQGENAGRDVRQTCVSIGSRAAEEHLSTAVFDQAACAGKRPCEAGIARVHHDATLSAVQVEVIGEIDLVIRTRARVDHQRRVAIQSSGADAAPVNCSDITETHRLRGPDCRETATIAGELHLTVAGADVAGKACEAAGAEHQLAGAEIAGVAERAAELKVASRRERPCREGDGARIDRRAARVVVGRIADVKDTWILGEEQLVDNEAAKAGDLAGDVEGLVVPARADVRRAVEGQRAGERVRRTAAHD